MTFSEDFGYHDLERAALGYVLADDVWPLFIEAARGEAATSAAVDYLATADLAEARRYWLLHSPDPRIRALGVISPPEALK